MTLCGFTGIPPEISHGDPFFAAGIQFQADKFLIYGDAMASFGGSRVFLGRVGVSYSF